MFSLRNPGEKAHRRYRGSPFGLSLCVIAGMFAGQSGCSEGRLGTGSWGSRGAVAGGETTASSETSESNGEPKRSGDAGTKPTITVPESTTSEAAHEEPADEDMQQLHERIQAYVNRFPANEPDQKTNGGHRNAEQSAPPDDVTGYATGDENAVANYQVTSQEPGPSITTIVKPAGPVESDEAASPSEPSNGNAVQVPSPTEASVLHAAPDSTSTPPKEEWGIRDRAADDGKAWPAVTGRPTTLPPRADKSNSAVELVDVRPAISASEKESPGARSVSPANQPVEKEENTPTGMDGYLQQLEHRVAQNPNQFDDLYKLRLLYAATGQRDKAIAPVEDLDEAHAAILQAMLNVIAMGDQVLTQPSASATEALVAVDELRRLLRQQSPVIIPNIAMVTRVNSFGDYVAVDPPVFEAGRPVHVFVYTEIANFRSEPTADGRLRTVLSETVQVFDADGRVVWERSVPEFEDRTLSPRHDFFYPFEVRLPADLLSAGEYALKVTVEDKLGATTDQQRLTFSIQ